MGYIGEYMITVLNVNNTEFTVEYELDVQAIYFGNLESEYIDIQPESVFTTCVDDEGEERFVDVLPILKSMEQEEALKIILRDRMEDES
jgi:hypothetical protein